MEELLISGCKDFLIENYLSALTNFTKIIDSNTEYLSQALLYRANTFRKLGDFTNSLIDLEKLLNSNSNIDTFELFFKLGQTTFDLERFTESNEYFKKALTLSSNPEQREKLILWSNKLEIELIENNLLSKIMECENPITNPETTLHMHSNVKFIHNWFQTPLFITVNIDCSIPLNNSDFTVLIEKKLIKITTKHNNQMLYELHLCNGINPLESSFNINNRKIEIKLKKEIDNFEWVTLEKQINTSQNIHGIKPNYPSSSQVKKDWDNIDKEIGRELESEDLKGNDAMMKLFKSIYERGNEETRRAMTKSFQTSGGTVLSTNWGEVKEKEYDGVDRPTAPDGQEWADKVEKK